MIVPCGSIGAYQAAYASTAGNTVICISEAVLDTLADMYYEHGSVEVYSQPTCTEPAVVHATANVGYQFSYWSDGNSDNPRTLSIGATAVPTPVFAEATHSVIVTTNNPDMGVASGGGVYNLGDIATLYALVQKGFRFQGWNNGVEANPYSLIVEGDTSIIAIFETTDTVFRR